MKLGEIVAEAFPELSAEKVEAVCLAVSDAADALSGISTEGRIVIYYTPKDIYIDLRNQLFRFPHHATPPIRTT